MAAPRDAYASAKVLHIGRDELVIEEKPTGCGGQGEVFRAMWNKTTPVSVKKLHRRMDAEREVSFLHSLPYHPNVLQLHGVCEAEETSEYLIVTEWMERGSVRSFLAADRTLPLSGRVALCIQAAMGIRHLHCMSSPVLHRDITTLNILMNTHGNVKVGDFGHAVPLSVEGHGAVCPLQWKSPELLEEEGTASTASDVYALGVTLWEILTGGHPFLGVDPRTIHEAIKTGKLLTIPSHFPARITSLLHECWAFDPASRPTCNAIILALQKIELELEANSNELLPRRVQSANAGAVAMIDGLIVMGWSERDGPAWQEQRAIAFRQLRHEYQPLLLERLPDYFAQVWEQHPASVEKHRKSKELTTHRLQHFLHQLAFDRGRCPDFASAVRECPSLFKQRDSEEMPAIPERLRGGPDGQAAHISADTEGQIERWNRIQNWVQPMPPDRSQADGSLQDCSILDETRRTAESFRTQMLLNTNSQPLARNAILHGLPGTGKTMQVKWIGRELKMPVYKISAAAVFDKYHAEDHRRFDALIEAMRLVVPAILFFDELEGFFPSREYAAGGNMVASSVSARLPFLGENPIAGLFIVGACNHIEQVDSAVVSRFSAHLIKVEAPRRTELAALYSALLNKSRFRFYMGDGDQQKDIQNDCKLVQALASLHHPSNFRDVTTRVCQIEESVFTAVQALPSQWSLQSRSMELKRMGALDVSSDQCRAWNVFHRLKEEQQQQQLSCAMAADAPASAHAPFVQRTSMKAPMADCAQPSDSDENDDPQVKPRNVVQCGRSRTYGGRGQGEDPEQRARHFCERSRRILVYSVPSGIRCSEYRTERVCELRGWFFHQYFWQQRLYVMRSWTVSAHQWRNSVQ